MPQQNCFFLYIFALGTLQEPLKSGAREEELKPQGGGAGKPRFLPALQRNLTGSSPSLVPLGRLMPTPSRGRAELGFSPDVGVLGDEAQHLQAE